MKQKSRNKSSFDSRCKIILLIITVFIATQAPTLSFLCGLMLLIALFSVFCGKGKAACINLLVFMVLYIIRTLALQMRPGSVQTMILAWLGLMYQVYPCSFMAGIILSTTKINEFLTAMTKAHISQKITIPMAVMLRYLPNIREDWHFIKDAMRMRNISPTIWGFLTNPSLTIECLYTPLLLSASRVADELTIAAVTRGVETPNRRSCLVQVHFTIRDYLAILIFATYFIAMKFGGVA